MYNQYGATAAGSPAGQYQVRPIQLGGVAGGAAAAAAPSWTQGQPQQQAAGNVWQNIQQQRQAAAEASQGQAAPAAAAAGSALEVGAVQRIIVTGCGDPVVGNYMRGTYSRTGMNHGKPVYKRDAKVAGSDVLIYYWDERDGLEDSGWWFAPEIGGSLVWAYHPNRQSRTVPTKGWKAPISAGVDPSVNIRAVTPQETMALQMQGTAGATLKPQAPAPGIAARAPAPAAPAAAAPQLLQPMQNPEFVKQQQQARQIQEAANRQKLQEQMATAQAANRQRAEEQRQKVKEEAMKRMEQQKQRTEEAKAMGNIMKVVRKLKACSPEELEDTEAELIVALEEDVEKCGALKPRVEADAKTGLAEAKVRVEQLIEKRQKDEEAREELAKKREEAREELIKKRKESEARATELLNDLSAHICSAEVAVERLEEVQGSADSADTPGKIEKVMQAMETAKVEAFDELKVCKDFMQSKRSVMILPSMQALNSPLTAGLAGEKKDEKGGLEKEKEAPPPSLKDLAARLQTVDARCIKAKVAEGHLATKMKAKAKLNALQAIFTKHDKDKDGHLSAKEVKAYAKAEFSFVVPQTTVDSILKKLAGEGGKGVPKEKLQALKVQIGLARDVVRNDELKAERVRKEDVLKATKNDLKNRVDQAMAAAVAAKTCISKVEGTTKEVQKVLKDMGAPAMLEKADTLESELSAAKAGVAEAQKQVSDLEEDIEPDLKKFLEAEMKKVMTQMTGFDSRIARVAELLPRFRTKARAKDFEELQALESRARGIFRDFMLVKELDVEAAFAAIAGSKKELITDDRLITFFAERSKDVEVAKKAAEEDDDSDDEAVAKRDKKRPKLQGLTDAQTTRLMPHLDDEGEEGISKDNFMRLTWVYMKVVKALVMTEDLDIRKESMRKLEVGEVVRILEGPVSMPDEKGDLERVRACAVSDGLEGWITIKGNKGTIYLEEVNGLYKVAKEAILTDDFEIGGKTAKDDVKLRVGDCVQVREWPKKEKTSGLVRMKCKVKTGAQLASVGWVTVMSNGGAVFLEPVS